MIRRYMERSGATEDDIATAVHEAGHAVVALELGLTCGGARLYDGANGIAGLVHFLSMPGQGDDEAIGGVEPSISEPVHRVFADLEGECAAILAGGIAMARFQGRRYRLGAFGDSRDGVYVHRLAADGLAVPVTSMRLICRFLNRPTRRARRAVRRRWGWISRVAIRLHAERALTGEQIAALRHGENSMTDQELRDEIAAIRREIAALPARVARNIQEIIEREYGPDTSELQAVAAGQRNDVQQQIKAAAALVADPAYWEKRS